MANNFLFSPLGTRGRIGWEIVTSNLKEWWNCSRKPCRMHLGGIPGEGMRSWTGTFAAYIQEKDNKEHDAGWMRTCIFLADCLSTPPLLKIDPLNDCDSSGKYRIFNINWHFCAFNIRPYRSNQYAFFWRQSWQPTPPHVPGPQHIGTFTKRPRLLALLNKNPSMKLSVCCTRLLHRTRVGRLHHHH